MHMAALCGVVKVILSFFRHGQEGAVERHRSRLTANFDEQRNISTLKKTYVRFSWYKGAGRQVRLWDVYELKFYRGGKSGGKAENYAIITQGQ